FAGINLFGSIVGNFQSPTHPFGAFEIKDGKLKFIQVAKHNQLVNISDTGVIVGTYAVGTAPNEHTHGFVLANGQFRDFSFPGATNTLINDINAQGEIVGTFDGPGQ